MRAFYHDTDYTVYRILLSKDSGGASVEAETLIGTTKGKYDLVGGNYRIQGRLLSANIQAVIYSNDYDVQNGDIVVVQTIRYRAETVDRSTLRGRLAHIEIYLTQEVG